MKTFKNFLTVVILTLSVIACSKNSGTDANKLNIYAAAGTRSATNEVCDLFEKNNSCKVDRNFAASGTLARQIANGADCDVYISANKQWVDFLVGKGLLVENSIRKIGGNSLAIIAPVNSKLSGLTFNKNFNILSQVNDKIVIGDPAYVPVGKYTKGFLENLGWFNKLKGKMIMAKDVSSVLRYVELGECDWGVVYYTEAIKSKKVKIISKVPGELHKPITFYVADTKGQNKMGTVLSSLFADETGQSIFAKYGFDPVKE